ncbi:uncharacterized protein LOC121179003 isoform X2 [Toxotes jaculatrix]|uniref:uncharacterized protein LOC121179003 isoform X2 n=1 Tax=Toxotes jaculatrix TaxID=941984 RepID=UPI001B3A9621|nr:uncharacterized protein LOC121179003 isoform X2 [Toxotes jaculatrix]
MAGHLLLVVLMYSFSENKAQVPLPPTLTVNPPVITDSDSVTLNCQTPSSVSASHCYFRFVREGPAKSFSCLKTMTGTELLLLTHQTLPAEVKVICFYFDVYQSQESNMSSIIIQNPQPTLTVNPPVITDRDSVTLNCQTPSSVSVSQCYFRFVREEPAKSFSCLKTLSGTELLLLTHQTSPAEVKVTCFYLDGDQSQESIMSSIIIQNPQPKLTVNPLVITETDSVTLSCQTPSSVSVSQCLFYTVKEQNTRVTSCLKTLTGTELLNMAHQSSPAVVEVTCYYTAEHRGGQYQSPHSNISSITIQTLPPPTLTAYPPMIRETDSVTLNCQTPSSVSASHCYYITVKGQTLNALSCLTTLTGAELLHTTHQSSPAEVKLTCYYRVKVFSVTSPHSNIFSITINNAVKIESSTMQKTVAGETTTAGIGANKTVTPASKDNITETIAREATTVVIGANKTVTPASKDKITGNKEIWIWKVAIAVTGLGVTVGIILLGLLCTKTRSGKRFYGRSQAGTTDDTLHMRSADGRSLPAHNNKEGYSMVSSVPGADGPSGSENLNSRDPKNENSDTYHVYATISEEPPASALNITAYSTLQSH